MNKRFEIADLLKGIAVLLMIQVHIIELFATISIFDSKIGRFLLFLGGPFVAPVFLFVFGYFIAHSSQTNSQQIGRGFKIFFYGMLLNVALNFNLFIKHSEGQIEFDIFPYLFGVDVLQCAGLSLIIITVIKKVFYKNKLIAIALLLFSAFLGGYLLQYKTDFIVLKYLSAFFYGSTSWSYFPVFPWIGYPLMGMLFFKSKIDFKILAKPIAKISICLLLIVFLFFTLNYAIALSSNLSSYYHHGLTFFLWTMIFLGFYGFMIYEVAILFGKYLVFKYIKWLGQNVTALYVIQWILIGNISTAVYKSIDNPIILLVAFIGILLLSSIIAFLYLQIKEGKKFAD
jgi:Heparan-alpha-glucosaminide N-acetyltransferase, catalytic